VDHFATNAALYIRTLQIRVGYFAIYEVFTKMVGEGGKKMLLHKNTSHIQSHSIPHTYRLAIQLITTKKIYIPY
jgi:hypothetical protein